jgi:hypothetical protein
MAEKEGVDINDSKPSEVSPLEEIDLDDQIEIIPVEMDTVEPLEVLQEEVAGEEAESESDKPDSDTFNEFEVPSSPDDAESELPSKEIEAEKPLETVDEHKDGQSDQDEFEDDDFLGLDDEEFDDEPPEEKDPSPETLTMKSPENGDFGKNPAENNETAENPNDDNNNKKASRKTAEKSGARILFRKPSLTQITIGLTSLVLFIAGAVIYANPSLIGFKRVAQPAPFKTNEPTPSVQTVQTTPLQTVPNKIESAKPLSKSESYLTKIKDAGLLRDELLEKKEEIYRLKLHYQNGIADLEEQISRELQKEGITSYTEAFKNRRIELNLRTIQRRRSYIHGLEKPTRWIKQGGEELLYLKRKAEFDLQLIDIAGGIDMDRHMRHIDAAIQKYQPSAEKLAVERENTDLSPLETIWGQMKNQNMKTGKALTNVTDEEITKEICSGNYERTAELTGMSAATAQCLSKKNGPDLFLNGLTTLSPAAAKYLFRWRGSWICINSIKELSPAVAQSLFKWEGNWISLNGLIEFPPELATYLMEWEGKQLELMGLRYNKKNADPKALKYLALWETMGGKLFISDDVRKEIERVMM